MRSRPTLALVVFFGALTFAQSSQQQPEKATTSSSAASSGTPTKADDGKGSLPLEEVEDYLTMDKHDVTTLQDDRRKSQMVDRKYSGIVRVTDVKEAGDRVVLEYFNFPSQSQLLFSISDPKLKEIAARPHFSPPEEVGTLSPPSRRLTFARLTFALDILNHGIYLSANLRGEFQR